MVSSLPILSLNGEMAFVSVKINNKVFWFRLVTIPTTFISPYVVGIFIFPPKKIILDNRIIIC